MDINSATPDVVGPLPFHGMTRYPYASPEAFPMTERIARLREQYNTRVVVGAGRQPGLGDRARGDSRSSPQGELSAGLNRPRGQLPHDFLEPRGASKLQALAIDRSASRRPRDR